MLIGTGWSLIKLCESGALVNYAVGKLFSSIWPYFVCLFRLWLMVRLLSIAASSDWLKLFELFFMCLISVGLVVSDSYRLRSAIYFCAWVNSFFRTVFSSVRTLFSDFSYFSDLLSFSTSVSNYFKFLSKVSTC